ncbi:hypothetical protein AAHA92_24879 [Salvia divinorum]|uniref:Uncharacterized protein n=1 Tax=Salvia divinorum TaxID=28513 RepID=A0ABD1G8Y3_SALDI
MIVKVAELLSKANKSIAEELSKANKSTREELDKSFISALLFEIRSCCWTLNLAKRTHHTWLEDAPPLEPLRLANF